MKKPFFIWPLSTVVCMILLMFIQTPQALADQDKTETGITFNQSVEPDKPKMPIYETKPTVYPNTSGSLPHLGQMMTSFIVLLLGVGCLIVFLGVISLRKVYNIQI